MCEKRFLDRQRLAKNTNTGQEFNDHKNSVRNNKRDLTSQRFLKLGRSPRGALLVPWRGREFLHEGHIYFERNMGAR
jgi:hypothetical protein